MERESIFLIVLLLYVLTVSKVFGSSLRRSRVNLILFHVTFLTFKVFKVDQCIAVHSISIIFSFVLHGRIFRNC